MKQLFALLCIASFLTTDAQLVNGSFEDNGAFTLQGWEWSCDEPEGWLEAPPGGGIWSAYKEASQAKGCFPSYLFQRIVDVPYGVPVQLSGWLRCPVDDIQPCFGATMAFGSISSGVVTPFPGITSTDPEWTFLTVSHAFDPGIGDTAIVLLSAGFVGGPSNPLPAGFDELALDIAQAMDTPFPARVSHFPDPATDQLHLGITQGLILSFDVLDASGRIVLTAAGGSGTRSVDVSALPPGTYVGRVRSTAGDERFTFVKR